MKKYLLPLFAFCLVSCGPGPDYRATVLSGIGILPWPKQMETLFGEGDHFITHYGFDTQPKQWNTEVYFGGRYVLTLQVDVAINHKDKSVVTNTTPATFYLTDMGIIHKMPDGSMTTRPANGWILDEEQWSRLVAAQGDWSAVGISLRSNDPVPDFDEYVRAKREPRVRVR